MYKPINDRGISILPLNPDIFRAKKISESEYDSIREKIRLNPKFNITPKEPNIFDYFESEFGTLKICFWGILIGIVLSFLSDKFESDGDYGIIFYMPSFLFATTIIFSILFKNSKYKKYVNDFKRYYDVLEKTIKTSNSFEDFDKNFNKKITYCELAP